MPTPFRLEALKRLTAVLEEITTGNGYSQDMTGRVFRGRAIFGDNDPVPMLSILEVPQPPEQIPPPASGTTYKGDWDLVIQGFLPDDRENPTDPAHYLLADVKRRLAEEKRKGRKDFVHLGFKNAVTGIEIGPGVVRPPDEVSDKAYFWLTVTLQVVDDLTDPFTY